MRWRTAIIIDLVVLLVLIIVAFMLFGCDRPAQRPQRIEQSVIVGFVVHDASGLPVDGAVIDVTVVGLTDSSVSDCAEGPDTHGITAPFKACPFQARRVAPYWHTVRYRRFDGGVVSATAFYTGRQGETVECWMERGGVRLPELGSHSVIPVQYVDPGTGEGSALVTCALKL